jgi:uncharacterized protein (TIGR02996 family)
MGDGEALLRAILACPDDDAPRLVYADWLEESGQAERAAAIRAGIARLTPTSHTGPALLWPDCPAGLEWHALRGFAAGVTLPVARFLAEAGELFRAQPIVRVDLSDRRPGAVHGPGPVRVRWRAGALPSFDGAIIPRKLWPFLTLGTLSPDGDDRDYDAGGDALGDLSAAAVAYGRAAAGLSGPRR